MPVTDQDARALAYLARRIRQDGNLGVWDQAGIDAVTKQLVGRGLVPTVERVAHHAADKNAQTPGAILRPFVPKPTDTDRAPRPPKPHEACLTCGRHAEQCVCGERATRAPIKADYDQHVSRARAALRGARDA